LPATEYNAGFAYLTVLPTMKEFKPDLDKQLKGINPVLDVLIRPQVDPAALPEADRDGTRAGGRYGDAFDAAVKGRIDAALRSLPDITVHADSTEAEWKLLQLREQLEDLSRAKIGVDIDAVDALAKVEAIRSQLDDLAKNDPNVQIRVDAADAADKLAAISDEVSRLDHRTATIDVRVDPASLALAEEELNKAKEAASSGSSGGGFQLGTGGLIAGGIGLGAGPLAAGALAAVPAAFAAIGVAAERSDAQVSAAFTNLETSAKRTAQSAFSPFASTLTDLANEGRAAIGGMEPELYAAASATAPLIHELGDGVISAAKSGVGGAAGLIRSLQPETQAVATGIGQVAHGIGGFFAGINAGTATRGLETLFTDVEQILPAAARLLNEVTPLGNALLQVLGPALVSTINDASALEPVIAGVSAGLRFLEPDITVLGPPLLAAMAASKLLTGSWLDFAGAAGKVKSLVADMPSLIESLGQKLGYTTASTNAAAKASLDQANDLAQLRKAAADEAVAQATLAAEQDDSKAAALALAEAQQVATVAANEAKDAETALAAATDAASFSAGPLVAILTGLGLIIGPLIANATSASRSTDQLSGSLQKLQQAAADTKSLSELFQSDPQAEQQLQTLQKYGVTLKDLADANNGQAAAQQKVAAATQQAAAAAQAKLDVDQKALASMKAGSTGVNEYGQSMGTSSDAIRQQQAAVDADRAALDKANQVNKDAQGQVQATTAAQAAQTGGIGAGRSATTQWTSAIQAASQAVVAHGGDLLATTQQMYNFEQATGETAFSAEAFVKAQVAAAGANIQAAQSFQQLDQAVSSAKQSYAQSVQSVQDAEHSQVQAAEAATQTAEAGVATAIRGVQTAQQSATNAEIAAKTATDNLTAARKAAAQQLADYNLQLKDQSDSEAEAKLRVLDAQQAVNAAGLQGKSLASLGDPTVQNEANYKLLLTLQEAQNNLNDVTSQGSQLRQEAAAAQAAGIEGNAQVIAAEQQVVQAQQQEAQTAQSLVDARNAVTQAGRAVAEAEYQQSRAAEATQQAISAEHQASIALTTARDNASRSTDINTLAGNRNTTTIIGLYDAQIAAGKTTDQARTAVENETTALGFAKDKVDAVITSIQAVPPSVTFGIVGQPTLDTTALLQNAQQQGINLYSLGLPTNEVADYIDQSRGGIALTKATGGPITGWSPTDTADNVPVLATAGEFMHSVPAVRYYGTGIMEAINNRQIPREAFAGFASGGLIGQTLLTDNYRLLGFDSLLGSMSTALTTLGATNVPQLPAPLATISFAGVAPTTGGIGLGGLGGGPIPNSAPASSGVRLAAQQYAQGQLARYGWGPDQMAALIALWNQESGWNPNAVNPSSGAYGIPQALGHGHPYALGDYIAQVDWGLGYIHDRYGSPDAAEAHERAFNWYDNGGWLPPGLSVVANGTGSPEAVFTGQQWDLIAASLAAGNGNHGLVGAELSGTLDLGNGLSGYVDARITKVLDSTGSAIETRTRTL
jgi:hypothetical protein